MERKQLLGKILLILFSVYGANGQASGLNFEHPLDGAILRENSGFIPLTSIFIGLKNIVATLRAGAEYAGLSVQNCFLIAGSQSSVDAAECIGMACVVLRSSLTAKAEFRNAKAMYDGFGGADLTLSKLRIKRWS